VIRKTENETIFSSKISPDFILKKGVYPLSDLVDVKGIRYEPFVVKKDKYGRFTRISSKEEEELMSFEFEELKQKYTLYHNNFSKIGKLGDQRLLTYSTMRDSKWIVMCPFTYQIEKAGECIVLDDDDLKFSLSDQDYTTST